MIPYLVEDFYHQQYVFEIEKQIWVDLLTVGEHILIFASSMILNLHHLVAKYYRPRLYGLPQHRWMWNIANLQQGFPRVWFQTQTPEFKSKRRSCPFPGITFEYERENQRCLKVRWIMVRHHEGGSKNFRMFFLVHAKHGRCRSLTYWYDLWQ